MHISQTMWHAGFICCFYIFRQHLASLGQKQESLHSQMYKIAAHSPLAIQFVRFLLQNKNSCLVDISKLLTIEQPNFVK